ncbi:myb/SANT-like DNA-binding domain-containing protein 3 [Aphis gossypii]|uniref:myb/SANT-like DNA-binding domain-containing protein 3 n=2 Tax=Aphis gossypii TaxID=80765 RepID=UPI002158C894|nr:myb/SANT-like DNA-binding domain-containing protein 3 [Aphis gossypii]
MEDDKKRGKNFSETEKSILIDLILPYKHIIENIKTDGATNKEKDAAWSEIANSYNCQQITGIRTIRQLKSVYDVQKRKARKDKSDYKVELYKTGGGRNLSMLSSTTDKVIGLLGDRLEPLSNQYDCDSDYPNANNPPDEFIIQTLNEEDLSDDLLSNSDENSYLIEKPVTKKRSPEILLAPSNKLVKILDKQSVAHNVSTSHPATVEQNIKKKHESSAKKVYEGLNLLTSKHLDIIENKEKLKDNLNLLALKKSKLQLEITEMEQKIMVLKYDTEQQKCASELKQIKLKEQILESELRMLLT